MSGGLRDKEEEDREIGGTFPENGRVKCGDGRRWCGGNQGYVLETDSSWEISLEKCIGPS